MDPMHIMNGAIREEEKRAADAEIQQDEQISNYEQLRNDFIVVKPDNSKAEIESKERSYDFVSIAVLVAVIALIGTFLLNQ